MNSIKALYKLAQELEYSHAVFGEFGFPGRPLGTLGGMQVRENKGPDGKWLEQVMTHSVGKIYEDFLDSTGPEFEAVLIGGKFKGKAMYTLVFNERQTDSRHGVYAAYMLAVPEEDEEIQEEIRKNPSKVIDLFREEFPEYDRSKGSLKIVKTKL